MNPTIKFYTKAKYLVQRKSCIPHSCCIIKNESNASLYSHVIMSDYCHFSAQSLLVASTWKYNAKECLSGCINYPNLQNLDWVISYPLKESRPNMQLALLWNNFITSFTAIYLVSAGDRCPLHRLCTQWMHTRGKRRNLIHDWAKDSICYHSPLEASSYLVLLRWYPGLCWACWCSRDPRLCRRWTQKCQLRRWVGCRWCSSSTSFPSLHSQSEVGSGT